MDLFYGNVVKSPLESIEDLELGDLELVSIGWDKSKIKWVD